MTEVSQTITTYLYREAYSPSLLLQKVVEELLPQLPGADTIEIRLVQHDAETTTPAEIPGQGELFSEDEAAPRPRKAA